MKYHLEEDENYGRPRYSYLKKNYYFLS